MGSNPTAPTILSMKIEGTQKVEIEISELTQKRIALQYIYETMNGKEDYFIEDGKVFEHVVHVVYATSHRFDQKEFRRDAMCIDKSVYSVVKELKKKGL